MFSKNQTTHYSTYTLHHHSTHSQHHTSWHHHIIYPLHNISNTPYTQYVIPTTSHHILNIPLHHMSITSYSHLIAYASHGICSCRIYSSHGFTSSHSSIKPYPNDTVTSYIKDTITLYIIYAFYHMPIKSYIICSLRHDIPHHTYP